MSYHILYESCGWHTRCALFDEHGRLLTLRYDEESRRLIEGAVVWGQVRRVEPSLAAAFVDIGDTQDGVLPFQALPRGTRLKPGQRLMVTVARGGFGEKGARLDARVALKPPEKGLACPLLITPPPSALTRALRDAGSTPVQVWLPHGLMRDVVAQAVPEKQIRQLDDLNESVPDWLERLDATLATVQAPVPTFPFPHGDIRVEITSAVATMDVNFKPLATDHTNAVMAANLAAAEEVARLVRLLDLGGSVIIDFITPKSRAHRRLIDDHLHAALTTTDDMFEELRPMSRHGLTEITRARSGPSLGLLLKLPAFVAGAIALELWRTPAGKNPKLKMQTVLAHPDVLAQLQARLTQEHCLRHLGRPLNFQADPTLNLTSWKLSG